MLTAAENEFITKTGPGTPMGELFRRFWIPALLSSELPSPDCPPVRLRLLGEDLVAFKDSDGKIALLDARCPHRLADLFFGRNEECGLRCVYHGWKFNVNGECVDMPNEPAESNFKSKIRTTAYPCREQGGVIWTYMGQKEDLPEMPQVAWSLVPESHRHVSKILVDCNYLQAMEGEIDNSHVGFLHSTLDPTARQRANPTLSSLTIHHQGRYMWKDRTPRATVKETDYGIMMGWRRNAEEAEHYHWHINQWLMPFTTVIAAVPGDSQLTVPRPPRDDETSWAFIVQWNAHRPLTDNERTLYSTGQGFAPAVDPQTFIPRANAENDFRIDRALQRSYNYTGLGPSTYVQDLALTSSMGTVVDRSKEHLGTSDTVIIAVRRKLRKLARDLQQGIEPYAARHGEVYRVRAVDVLLSREMPFDEGAKDLIPAQTRA